MLNSSDVLFRGIGFYLPVTEEVLQSYSIEV